MEAVEDIPGTALHEGIPWGWESFGEYLDAIDTPYSVDIGAQIPHVALRYYVMGDRCYDDATADDIARMADAQPRRAGRRRARVLDVAASTATATSRARSCRAPTPAPTRWWPSPRRCATAATGRWRSSPTTWTSPTSWPGSRPSPASSAARSRCCPARRSTAASGSSPPASPPRACEIRPQVGARPASVLMTLEGTLNPLRQFHTLLGDQGPADRRAEGRRCATRRSGPGCWRTSARSTATPTRTLILSTWHRMYVLPADLSYEPTYADSLAGIAEAQRRRRARGADGRDGRRPPDPVPVRRLPRAPRRPGRGDRAPAVGVRAVRRRRPLRRAVRRQHPDLHARLHDP